MAFVLDYQTWMGFKQVVSSKYTFEIRTAPEDVIGSYPLLELGVERIPNDPNPLYTPASALVEVPLLIPEETLFPLVTGVDDWECPENLKLDKILISPYISDTDHTAFSEFPWNMPMFAGGASGGGGASGIWIPVGDDSEAIPDSITDHDKTWVTNPNGWVFSPQKSGWWKQEITIAFYTTINGDTRGFFDGAFVWDGIDISSEVPPHIWYTYTHEFPWAARPWVSRALTWKITLAPAWTRGFYNHYYSSGSNYFLYQDRWRVPSETYPYIFYPEVVEDTGGGGCIPITQGVSLLGLLGLPTGATGGLKPMGGTDIFKFFKGGK